METTAGFGCSWHHLPLAQAADASFDADKHSLKPAYRDMLRQVQDIQHDADRRALFILRSLSPRLRRESRQDLARIVVSDGTVELALLRRNDASTLTQLCDVNSPENVEQNLSERT